MRYVPFQIPRFLSGANSFGEEFCPSRAHFAHLITFIIWGAQAGSFDAVGRKKN
jgi:hypothetical protein